jgi:hypothetical protein
MAVNPYGASIIDLIRQGGADQAAALQRNGQIRGQLGSDLGQMAQGTIGAILKERTEAPIRQADAAYRDAQVKHLAAEDADTVAKRKADEDAKATAAKVQRVHSWLGSLASIEDPKEREAVYQQGAQTFKADGTMPAENLPETFPGLGWVKARFTEGLPVVEQFKHLFPEQKAPEPFTLGPGQTRFDANGSQVANVPAAPPRQPGPVNLTPGSVLVDPASGNVIARGNPQREPQGATGGANDVRDAVQGMKDGTLPPQLPGRATKDYVAIMAEAKRQGYDLATAASDWTATQKHIASMNGAQQLRMSQAIDNASHSLDVIDDLASQWKGGKFPVLNRGQMLAAKNGVMGPQAQRIAIALDAQIADVTSELGNVYMGGNSPTDHALSLAQKNLSGDWSEATLKAMTKQSRQNLQIRANSMRNVGVAGASEGNPYAPPSPSAGTVTMRAPNGQTQPVPSDQVEHYKSLGATVVK